MRVINKRAKREYEILEKYEAGIILQGWEVKSIRERRIKLENSYVREKEDGFYLIGCVIAPYKYARSSECDPQRDRKLLLNKKEIKRIKIKLQSSRGLTIVPLSCYTKGSLIKLEIALARGRKKFEKKKLEKEKRRIREIEREIKEYVRG